MVSCIFTCTDDLDAEFPAVAARRARPRRGAAALHARDRRARGDGAGDPGAASTTTRPADHEPAHVYLGADAGAARRPRTRPSERLIVAESASPRSSTRCPTTRRGHGTSAPEAIADEARTSLKLASNESPCGPHPAVVEAIAARRRGHNRYPDPYGGAAAPPDRRPLRDRAGRDRGRQRLLRDPARRRRGALRARRRDRLRLAVVLDLPAPGAALGRPRDPRPARRRRRPRPRRDARPRSPRRPSWSSSATRTTRPAPTCRRRGSPRSCDRVPDHVTVILDEAYIEFQIDDDPDATVDLLPRVPEPRPAAHVQQGLRARRAAGRLRALLAEVPRRGRRGAPAVQRQRARPGGRGRGDPPPGRRRGPGRAQRSSSGSASRRGCASSGLDDRRLAGQLLLGRPRRPRRGRGRRGARRARASSSGPGRRSAAPATSASPTAPRPRTSAFLAALGGRSLPARQLALFAASWYKRGQ